MSTPDYTVRSPLAAPGTPDPFGAAPADVPPPDLGAPPAGLQVLPPPPGPGDEIDLLKSLIVTAKDYLEIPTVDESEKLEMERVTTILQKLLADNQRMSDSATGASPQARKLLGGVGLP